MSNCCISILWIGWIKENLPKYIYFYNNHRPQIKLNGMSPIEYRLDSFHFHLFLCTYMWWEIG
ncbi:IS3 family transposase [Spiroplasma endosymbiont of Dactylopius coccus]